jgi:hypothetical protein
MRASRSGQGPSTLSTLVSAPREPPLSTSADLNGDVCRSWIRDVSASIGCLSERLRARAAGTSQRVVFCEAADPRVQEAAAVLSTARLGEAILLEPDLLSRLRGELEAVYLPARLGNGVSRVDAIVELCDPLLVGALMVRAGLSPTVAWPAQRPPPARQCARRCAASVWRGASVGCRAS